ncbi:MAG: methyltransferase domain-containing protein [Erythrobacter sp.]|nr:methyltransferase domain-containing protein [Erythrobacter sp.]
MTDKSEWQGRVGETWAAEWRRTDRSFGQLTERLLARTREFTFDTVLDVGCGAGELSLAIARGRPDVSVTGVDVSPSLVATAQDRGSHMANLAFTCTDAAQWQAGPDQAPDLLVSRHGVMFFDNPPAAFENLARQAQPQASLMFSCFRKPAENPFFTDVLRLLPSAPPPPDPDAPGPFAFADRDHVIPILRAGGWENIVFEAFDFPMVTGAGEDPIEDAVSYFSAIGPAAAATREMDKQARARFLDRVRELAQRNCRDGVVSLSAAAWIVTASKVA